MTYEKALKRLVVKAPESASELNAAVYDLCETVYDITTVASMLIQQGRIHVEDSRELFHTIRHLANEFAAYEAETVAKTGEKLDYMSEVEEFALGKLLKEFPVKKQYHVRLTRVYEFFVDATTEEEAFEEAETNYYAYTNGLCDDASVEIIDSYAAGSE